MIEVWKAVDRAPETYEVSNLGRVRSIDRVDARGCHRRGKLLTGSKDTHGYWQVSLWYNHRTNLVLVHHLVLEAFIGSKPEGLQACHNNGDRTDNQVGNLRWDTPAANLDDQYKHGRQQPRGEEHWNAKLTESEVVAIKHGLRLGVTQQTLADFFNIHQTVVSDINCGLIWKHI